MLFEILEKITLITGVIYVALQIPQSKWMWPFDIVCALASVVLYAGQHIWAMMGLNVYYLVMGFVGVFTWTRDDKTAGDSGIHIRRLKRSDWVMAALIMSLGTFLFYLLLSYLDDAAPLLDAIVATSGIVGTWWLVRAHIQNWLVWMFSDCIAIILCISQGMYWLSLMYLSYIIVSVFGFNNWRKNGKVLES